MLLRAADRRRPVARLKTVRPKLRVIARSIVFRYKGLEVDPLQAARTIRRELEQSIEHDDHFYSVHFSLIGLLIVRGRSA